MSDFILSTPTEIQWIFISLFIFLALCSVSFHLLILKTPTKFLSELKSRTNSWWKIAICVFIVATFPKAFATIIFIYLSFLAFREVISVIPLRSVDRKTLAIAYLSIPLHYLFIYLNWIELYTIFIPIIMLFVIAAFISASGIPYKAGRSIAIIYTTCILTIFLPSHLMMILNLDIPNHVIGNTGLFVFFIFIIAFNDVFQFVWGKLLGKTMVLPKISPNKTLEGLLLGVSTTILLALVLRFLTPFNIPHTIIIGGLVGFSGFIGDISLSAVKRDLIIKDFSQAIPGHGGVLDRIDSLIVGAPIFYYFVRHLIPAYL